MGIDDGVAFGAAIAVGDGVGTAVAVAVDGCFVVTLRVGACTGTMVAVGEIVGVADGFKSLSSDSSAPQPARTRKTKA